MLTSTSGVHKRGRLRVIASGAAVLGLALAACGSDNGGSSSATTAAAAATTAAAVTTAAAATTATTGSGGAATTAASSGAAPTGAPIKVMTEAPVDSQIAPYPNIPETAKLYEKFINEKGGIKGRPLQVVVCDDRADAGEAANCARKAVEEKVVANVGSFTVDVSRGIPILEENKIAWFGACCPIVSQENTSKISFPMGFVNGFPTAAAIQMIDDGCASVAEVYGDLPVADVFHESFANGWKSKGKDPSGLKVVRIPLAPGDYSAQAAQVGDVDCLFANISQVNWPPLITALDGVGASPRLYGPQGNLDETIVEQFPDQTNGGVIMSVYPNIEAPVWDDFRASIEKYNAPDLNYNSLAGLGTWTALTAFTNIVEGMTGEINNVTFLDAASKMTKVDTGGMVATLDFTKEWAGGKGQFPRIFNRFIYQDAIEDGKVIHVDKPPLDISNAFDGNPA